MIFIGFVLAMLALDLGVFHRKSHTVGFKESLGWSAIWITLGLAFSIAVYFAYEHHWCGLGMTRDFAGSVAVGRIGSPGWASTRIFGAICSCAGFQVVSL